jgi:hypothetical protein
MQMRSAETQLALEIAALQWETKAMGLRLGAKIESAKHEVIRAMLVAVGLQTVVILGALLFLARCWSL